MPTHRRTFPGRPEAVRSARQWTRATLDGHPDADDAALIVTELSANAVRHTASGRPSGTFHVTVTIHAEWATIAVTDHGTTATTPHIAQPTKDQPDGRGLGIVATLAHHVDIRGDHHGRTITAHLTPGTSPAGHPKPTPRNALDTARPATAEPATDYQCEATAHTPADDRAFPLGSCTAPNPRLAVRWLRRQAQHIAEQLDPAPAQRAHTWLADPAEHERALTTLREGEAYLVAFTDDTTRYTLTAHPAQGPR